MPGAMSEICTRYFTAGIERTWRILRLHGDQYEKETMAILLV